MKLTLTNEQRCKAFEAFYASDGYPKGALRSDAIHSIIDDVIAALPEPELAEPIATFSIHPDSFKDLMVPGRSHGSNIYVTQPLRSDWPTAHIVSPASKRDRAIAKLDSIRGVYASEPTNAELADAILALGGK